MNLTDGEYYAQINGILHWYRVAGGSHGTVPLVVLHGGPGGNVYVFERTIGALLERFTTIVYYEQRGCGRSEAPTNADNYSLSILVDDLEQLRLTIGVDRMTLLGFSFGCELALEYVLAHPARVTALILQCPSIAASGRAPMAQIYGLEFAARGELRSRIQALIDQPGPLGPKPEQAWKMVDSETVDRLLFVDPVHAARNRAMWQESGLLNTGDMARALDREQGAATPLYRRTSAVQQPCLVIAGLHDRNIGVDIARDVSDQLPNGTIVVFNSSAHFPDIEESERYAMITQEFLATEMRIDTAFNEDT